MLKWVFREGGQRTNDDEHPNGWLPQACRGSGEGSLFFPHIHPLRHPNRLPSNKRNGGRRGSSPQERGEEATRGCEQTARFLRRRSLSLLLSRERVGEGERKDILYIWRRGMEGSLSSFLFSSVFSLPLPSILFFRRRSRLPPPPSAACQHWDRDKWGQFMGGGKRGRTGAAGEKRKEGEDGEGGRGEAGDRQSSARNKRRPPPPPPP